MKLMTATAIPPAMPTIERTFPVMERPCKGYPAATQLFALLNPIDPKIIPRSGMSKKNATLRIPHVKADFDSSFSV